MNVEILTLLLSWNRPHLLEKTIHSYFKTISVSHRFIVIDNASNEETKSVLKKLSSQYNFRVEYLKENIGGLAFNQFLDKETGYHFIHFSENDIEYHLGWDRKLIKKFHLFPRVGQISPFSPVPQFEKGEIWGSKVATPIKNKGEILFLTYGNVGTTSLVRAHLIEKGLRWKNYDRKEKGGFKIPDDIRFSRDVKKLGWKVAWNDEYLITNWGHNITEFEKNLEYYIDNYETKNWMEQFKKRLLVQGYNLIKRNGRYKIEQIEKDEKF